MKTLTKPLDEDPVALLGILQGFILFVALAWIRLGRQVGSSTVQELILGQDLSDERAALAVLRRKPGSRIR